MDVSVSNTTGPTPAATSTPLKPRSEPIQETSEVCTESKKNRSFSCDRCSYVSSRQSNLKRHQRIKHECNQTHCTTCGRTFGCKDDVEEHVKEMHQGDYICEDCGKEFTTRKGLNYHMSTHDSTSVVKYTCQVCQKGFKVKSHYMGHINSHHGLRPYTCDTCTRGFAFKSNYTRHIKTCKGEDKKTCAQCGDVFSSVGTLKEHFRGKHQGKQYQCACGKLFNWRSSLSAHAKKCEMV